MEAFIGTIMLFGFNFPPRGWAICNGQLLSISQNTALFSLLGTMYGGNGQTTFGLPDLRGRVPMGHGQGPGLPGYQIGEIGGTPSVTLTQAELPPHTHSVMSAGAATSKSPSGNYPAVSTGGAAYGQAAAGAMAGGMVQPSGSGLPHTNMQPYLVGNWCIAVEGIFPSRQ
ncbi:tail fiber protein [Tessaracoccus terricola]